MKARNEPIRIGLLIHDVSRLRRAVYDQRMKPLGLTRSQWWILTGLSRFNGETATQTELANILEMEKVPLGRLIDRLEVRGFVVRKADPEDRRAKIIHLTEKARKVLDTMQSVAVEMNAKIMKGNSLEDQTKLVEILQNMKNNLISLRALKGDRQGDRRVERTQRSSRAPQSRPAISQKT